MTEKSDISDAQAKSVKCNMECNKVEMIEINAAEYPQCKKDSTTVNTQDEDCPIVYKCKNPIREDNIEKCPESELQEYRERCMS
ncbi:hypothetical protein GOV04_03535 [Candidatus Woesearchaeota archaeon]|nr:hypothetical protein [Candidatus Woesearchaeota archaeon]